MLHALQGCKALVIATGARPSINLAGPLQVDAWGVQAQGELHGDGRAASRHLPAAHAGLSQAPEQVTAGVELAAVVRAAAG